MIKEILYIINTDCWKCNKPITVALIRGDFDKRDGTTVGPEKFSEIELELAKKNGVIIKTQYSKTREESYLANTCSYCGNFIGQFFLYKDYFIPAQMGEYKFIEIELG